VDRHAAAQAHPSRWGARPVTDAPGPVEVLPDVAALAARAAERFVTTAAEAVRTSGRFTVGLSGGRTPERLYALLATPGIAARVDWPRVHVCWGDERCVPPTDAASNFRLAHDALLRHVPVPAANVHRIRGELDPAAAASAYESELRELFPPTAGRSPGARFDLLLLGLGTDGHTASLFPGLTAVRERDRWVAAEYVPAVSMWRVTLTPVAINAAAEIVFLVSGREKAPALRGVLRGPPDPAHWPAQAVVPGDGRLRWLVDAAAGESLPN